MTRSDDTGKLILRLALGILILLHGIAKLSSGVSGVGGMLASHGLPSALAYLVYVGEIVAPALVIIGFYTRPAAWIIASRTGSSVMTTRGQWCPIAATAVLAVIDRSGRGGPRRAGQALTNCILVPPSSSTSPSCNATASVPRGSPLSVVPPSIGATT